MIGQNELYLNDAEMRSAIEYYLNNVVMKIPVGVKSVEKVHNVGAATFRITLEETQEKTNAQQLTFSYKEK